MSSPADAIARRLAPRAVVALSRQTLPARSGAALRRRLGRSGRVELFFAFDDPCSAVALIDLAERVRGRGVQLILKPVVQRGIPADPAVELKRRYAIEDARRLGRRSGLALARAQPLRPDSVAFLARWAASTPAGPALIRCCTASMRELWFEPEGLASAERHAALWHEQLGFEPGGDGGERAVAGNERLMRRRGPYDTPAAWVHGQWFFAQDRLVQIGERLDDLGWSER